MNVRNALLLMVVLLAMPLAAAEGKIMKVLPLYLDAKGRSALSPSLYERDAYQAKLKRNKDLCRGLRMDVHFKTASVSTNLSLRIELRCQLPEKTQETVLTNAVAKTGFTGRWKSFEIDGDAFATLGDVLAWRATLWDGTTMLAEEKSFLW